MKKGSSLTTLLLSEKRGVSINTANSTHNTKAKDFSKFIKNNKKLKSIIYVSIWSVYSVPCRSSFGTNSTIMLHRMDGISLD